MKRALVAVAAGLIAVATLALPAAGETTPVARAWAVRIDLPGQPGALLLADVAAAAGAQPIASGAPLEIAGQAQPGRATATLQEPVDEVVFSEYDDPTASYSGDFGFANAEADPSSAQARAGLEASTGTGFALANELFTFEQQEQLLNQWSDLQAQIFEPLNQAAGTLAPVLGIAGLEAPMLEGISAVGLVNAMTSEGVSSTATASSSTGFSSARAHTTIRELNLFGGFVIIEQLSTEAISESVAGDDTREARATVGRLRIAGIEVVGDEDGLRVAGNSVLERTVIQGAFDTLLNALEQAGVTFRVVDTRARGDQRSAVALEITIASPQGPASISLGYAEASAPSVAAAGAAPGGATDAGTDVNDLPAFEPVVEPVGPLFADLPAGTPPGPEGGAQTIVTGPGIRRLPEGVAGALRTSYLLMIVGALAATAMIPTVLSRAPRARSKVLEEVSHP